MVPQYLAEIYADHLAEHIQSPELVVVSSAIAQNNPEYLAAKSQGIPIIKRGELLATLMNVQEGIAISGSHGKTTASALLADILMEAGINLNGVIGGKLNSLNSNACVGKSRYFLAEADESDQSFLYMYPKIAVVTSISPDHLVNYNDDFDALKTAFLQLLLQKLKKCRL